jgi:hypothetical protein
VFDVDEAKIYQIAGVVHAESVDLGLNPLNGGKMPVNFSIQHIKI